MKGGDPVERIPPVNKKKPSPLGRLSAQLGVRRDSLPGDWPEDYDDPSQPYTPAWQEPITGVDAAMVTKIAREFARNVERTKGRSAFLRASTKWSPSPWVRSRASR